MLVEARTWKFEQGQILLVEDDDFFAIAMLETFKEAGFKATYVSSGQAALDQLAAGLTPRCIVTDLHMPGINGFELLRQVRQNARLSTCPVIVISGQDEQAEINKAFRLGATSFLAKPINPTLLIHQIQLVLRAIREAA